MVVILFAYKYHSSTFSVFPSSSSSFAHFSCNFQNDNFLIPFLSYIAMASSTNVVDIVTHDTGNNLIAFNLAEKESLTIVPQPPSNDSSKVETWQRQILIPFMVAENLPSFHGPLPDERTQPRKVQKKIPCFTLVIPVVLRKMASSISSLWTQKPEFSGRCLLLATKTT